MAIASDLLGVAIGQGRMKYGVGSKLGKYDGESMVGEV